MSGFCRRLTQLLHRERRSGFTLIELLVVLVVTAILVTLVLQSFHGVTESLNLTSASTIVVSEFDLARQTALAQAQEIELRFLQLPDSQGNIGPYYRGLQLFRVADGTPIDKIQTLPAPIVIMDGSNATFSSVFASIPSSSVQTLPNGSTVNYKAIDFTTGGSITLASTAPNNDTWFVTLKSQNAPPIGTTAPAQNFITIQFDPITGKTQVFQP